MFAETLLKMPSLLKSTLGYCIEKLIKRFKYRIYTLELIGNSRINFSVLPNMCRNYEGTVY